MRCTNTQGGRESGVCAMVRVDGGVIGREDVNRMRCTNSQGGREGVSVRLGSPAFGGGTVTPLCPFLCPTPFPAMHTYDTYVYVGCASCLWLTANSWAAVRAERMLQGLLGRDPKYEAAQFYVCILPGTLLGAHGWDSVGIWKGAGREEPRAQSIRMVYFPTECGMGHVRKRWRPSWKAAARCTAWSWCQTSARGWVDRSASRIGVTKSRCILLYRTAARNGLRYTAFCCLPNFSCLVFFFFKSKCILPRQMKFFMSCVFFLKSLERPGKCGNIEKRKFR